MVFISYAREDAAAAAQLAQELAAEKIACVIDVELAEGDPFWREVIASRFQLCHLMVGLVSPHARHSPWVEQEQRAFGGEKLWIDLNHMNEPRSHERQEDQERGRTIECRREALRQIRRLVAGAHSAWQSESAPAHVDHARRTRLIDAEAQRHEAFVASLARRSRPRLVREGDVLFAGDDDATLELRRLRTATGDGRSHHNVFVSRTPITNAQYRTFLASTKYLPPPTWQRAAYCADSAPVTSVTWFEASAFASWVGGTLLSEDEWTLAAAGTDPARCFATADGRIDSTTACYGQPFVGAAPVASDCYAPNPEGYYGLCGNTWDWCRTPWGSHRVIRGGGFMDSPTFCRVHARYRNAPIDRDCCVGFRVKIELP